ncbi:Hypothetical predicted protein [Pelobates cultripes]|uniref:Zinc finger CCHC domain-containing protein n=1 Tax=Pelobates cultripes TaxID=61616 RepID=A0AAD1T041_PELCU|nr:Hypothetical predicted protein [Pelobates cultripes]
MPVRTTAWRSDVICAQRWVIRVQEAPVPVSNRRLTGQAKRRSCKRKEAPRPLLRPRRDKSGVFWEWSVTVEEVGWLWTLVLHELIHVGRGGKGSDVPRVKRQGTAGMLLWWRVPVRNILLDRFWAGWEAVRSAQGTKWAGFVAVPISRQGLKKVTFLVRNESNPIANILVWAKSLRMEGGVRSPGLKKVTFLVRNESIPIVDILVWTRRFGDVKSPPVKILDEDGIWTEMGHTSRWRWTLLGGPGARIQPGQISGDPMCRWAEWKYFLRNPLLERMPSRSDEGRGSGHGREKEVRLEGVMSPSGPPGSREKAVMQQRLKETARWKSCREGRGVGCRGESLKPGSAGSLGDRWGRTPGIPQRCWLQYVNVMSMSAVRPSIKGAGGTWKLLDRFWAGWEAASSRQGSRWTGFTAIPVSCQGVKKVTFLVRNESILVADILVWHMPNSFFIGADRVSCFYPGQPRACHKCGSYRHFSNACTVQKCVETRLETLRWCPQLCQHSQVAARGSGSGFPLGTGETWIWAPGSFLGWMGGCQGLKVVTFLVRNESIPTWTRRFGDVKSPPVKILDEDGIWTGDQDAGTSTVPISGARDSLPQPLPILPSVSVPPQDPGKATSSHPLTKTSALPASQKTAKPIAAKPTSRVLRQRGLPSSSCLQEALVPISNRYEALSTSWADCELEEEMANLPGVGTEVEVGQEVPLRDDDPLYPGVSVKRYCSDTEEEGDNRRKGKSPYA